jgi:STE24 endopeptidase
MAQTILYLIVALMLLETLFEQWLSWINAKHWSEHIPEPLQGIYANDEYLKSRQYQKVNQRFGMITSAFSLLLIILMLLTGGFALVHNWVSSLVESSILIALLFFGVIGLAAELLGLPFTLYDTFVIETRFGFNKTTLRTFLTDKLKEWLLTALLGGAILSLIIWLWEKSGAYFWLLAWGVITLVSLFFTLFYSNLIVPLFNKQTPLEAGELKTAIDEFAQKAGFQLKNIFVIDGSKRSTRANAYFTGLGPKKRIVLYDTLIKELSTHELVAVLAHEIGHYKKKHSVTGLILGVLQTGLLLFLFSLFVSEPVLSQALGVDEATFHIGLIAFALLYSPLSMLTGIGMNLLSRKHEYQADAYAADFGLADALASSLKKLSVNNLSNLTPHPWYVFFHYSHPTLLQRLNRLQNMN